MFVMSLPLDRISPDLSVNYLCITYNYTYNCSTPFQEDYPRSLALGVSKYRMIVDTPTGYTGPILIDPHKI